jgi:hypothetical protein
LVRVRRHPPRGTAGSRCRQRAVRWRAD